MNGLLARARWYWLPPVTICAWEITARRLQAVYFPPPSTVVATMHGMWFSGPAGR
ncbi:hypothetical protein [Nonomuraea sp. NPDC050691]|uniref:hypothetical protein n=1 Tax=Nonomuraea sp. NPDC050691 TaxID=3155661 RepID=UPI0033EA6695